MFRRFGELSSHSKLRREVVPTSPADPTRYKAPPAPGDQLELVFYADDDASADVPERPQTLGA